LFRSKLTGDDAASTGAFAASAAVTGLIPIDDSAGAEGVSALEVGFGLAVLGTVGDPEAEGDEVADAVGVTATGGTSTG
jgi:hypothetical protein